MRQPCHAFDIRNLPLLPENQEVVSILFATREKLQVTHIERRKIFYDNDNRDNFLERLGTVLTDTGTPCYAWALMPNHAHILLKTGITPIATVVRRLLTGYAVSFNRRHRRHGQLFQNRYKSILCQEDLYLLELVRYIHLNPLRAKLVENLKALDTHAYGGHSVMGKTKQAGQDADYILKFYANTAKTAIRRYREFVAKGIGEGRKPDLVGGGLVRSAGGWSAVKAMRKGFERIKGDERILGDGPFVEAVLKAAQENLERKYRLEAEGRDFKWLMGRVARLFGLLPRDVSVNGPHQDN